MVAAPSKLLTVSSILTFAFVFSMTSLDVVLSYKGWKPTFGDDLLAGIIGFLPSVGSVALSMLIGVTQSWRTKVLSSIIWLFCISISLTGNFLNMTSRAFESLDTENVAKVEVSNVESVNQIQVSEMKSAHQNRIDSFKAANKEQLELFDQENAELTIQYEKARELRDFQINDGVNSDGTIGPKAQAFQASMDSISQSIEQKRIQKRSFKTESTTKLLKLQDVLAQDLLQFHEQTSSTLSKANVDLAETQNDMRGHMPVIRYFIPDSEMQRQVVLWGLSLFAAVISLAGPVVSYAMTIHLNNKRESIIIQQKRSKKKDKKNTKEVIEKSEESVNNSMKKVKEAVASKDQKEVKTVQSSEKKPVSDTSTSKPIADKLSTEEEKKRAIAKFLGYM